MKADGRMKFDPSSEWTGGGLSTNPTMLVRFFAALAEGRVVSPESFQTMVAAGWQNPDTPRIKYGYGLFVYETGRQYGHAGMWPGYRTNVVYDFETGISVALQTNRDGPIDMWSVVEQIEDLATSE